jgi:hypothetical protein
VTPAYGVARPAPGVPGLTADEAEMFQVGWKTSRFDRFLTLPDSDQGEELVGKPE